MCAHACVPWAACLGTFPGLCVHVRADVCTGLLPCPLLSPVVPNGQTLRNWLAAAGGCLRWGWAAPSRVWRQSSGLWLRASPETGEGAWPPPGEGARPRPDQARLPPGAAVRLCDEEQGWLEPDLFNCTSPAFRELTLLVRPPAPALPSAPASPGPSLPRPVVGPDPTPALGARPWPQSPQTPHPALGARPWPRHHTRPWPQPSPGAL